jgi:sortase (surface protein transpeptidase)
VAKSADHLGILEGVSTESPKKSALKAAALLGGTPFILVVCAIALVTGSAITWVTSPNWGKVTTAAPARNIGTVPTAVPPTTRTKIFTFMSPNRIEIPKIDAVAPVYPEPTGPDRELIIPLDPKKVGWWNGGAPPGAPTGTAVFAGHINYAGVQGTLAHIGNLNPGDMIYVYGKLSGTTKKLAFKVSAVRTYRKTHLPFAEIFNQDVSERIVVVTCGGPFDAQTGNYLDNIVVYAVPA